MQEADHDVGVEGSMGVEDSDATDIQEGSNCLALLIQHTIHSPALSQAVVVRDSKDGTFLCGLYHRILHGNLASLSGRRFIISTYTTDLTI
eukprot:5108783-Pleurochrysis_carterae.AAC.1